MGAVHGGAKQTVTFKALQSYSNANNEVFRDAAAALSETMGISYCGALARRFRALTTMSSITSITMETCVGKDGVCPLLSYAVHDGREGTPHTKIIHKHRQNLQHDGYTLIPYVMATGVTYKRIRGKRFNVAILFNAFVVFYPTGDSAAADEVSVEVDVHFRSETISRSTDVMMRERKKSDAAFRKHKAAWQQAMRLRRRPPPPPF